MHGRILTVVPNLLWFTLVYQELFFTYRTRLPRQQYVFPWFFERELRLAVWANSDLVGDDHPEKIVPTLDEPKPYPRDGIRVPQKGYGYDTFVQFPPLKK